MFGITEGDILAWILFGSIGMLACAWGKMKGLWQPWVIGFVLMIYPYFFAQGLWLWVIGIVLTLLLPFARD